MLSLKKLLSKKGQISLEFTILMMTVVLAAVIVGYYMIKVALHSKEVSISTIDHTSNLVLQTLSRV
ncbi:MAG TPA: class III signal peptide-containing protein [Methanothermococcus okinawensis]|uniref:Class III signal peptide-containing protein n=1 Tax=Methanothermococcus okinawensis TaxID=155863 RepID=A0A832ZBC1_9EURY|nr:class III signal peptide-containing protein [Methanococcaceae archaeon]HIP84281.1 class III signal peptide-containing protein [Methanothermococcus okinawensis]HIP91446.1 class III signal peptide-containing protein [Methanothermococcus okinawensis]